MTGGRELYEFTELGEDATGLMTFETVFESEPMDHSVKATLFFQLHEVEDRICNRVESLLFASLIGPPTTISDSRDLVETWPWSKFDKELEERTRRLIERGEWDSAIRRAFVLLSSRIAARYNLLLDTDGAELINAAFGKNSLLSGLENKEKAAMRDLMAGLYGVFRNKYGHKDFDAPWQEVEAVMTMVNFVLSRLSREASGNAAPGQ